MNQLPAYLQSAQQRNLAESLAANLGSGSPPYVSIKSQRFTLIDASGAEEPVQTYDPKLGPYLDAVIIDANPAKSKIYYDVDYDPNAEGQAPACFSDNGIGPSRASTKPQAPTCASCPMNAWGSDISRVTGKQIKACSDVQKIALLIPGDDVIFLMRVPPASLKQLGAYVQKFKGQQAGISDVVTRITFDPSQMGLLVFNATAWIDEPTFKQREEALAAKRTDSLLGKDDLPIQGLPAPTAAPALAAPQPAPQQSQPMTTGFIQNAPATVQTSSAPQFVQPQAPQPVQPQQTAPAPRQRRRRNTEAVPAAQTPVQQVPAQAAPPAAPFMPSLAPQPQQAAQGGPGAPFGISGGVAPNPDVMSALNSVFGQQA